MEWKIKGGEGQLAGWLQTNDFYGSWSRDRDGVLTLRHEDGGRLHILSAAGKLWTTGSATEKNRLDHMVIVTFSIGKDEDDEAPDPVDNAKLPAPTV